MTGDTFAHQLANQLPSQTIVATAVDDHRGRYQLSPLAVDRRDWLPIGVDRRPTPVESTAVIGGDRQWSSTTGVNGGRQQLTMVRKKFKRNSTLQNFL